MAWLPPGCGSPTRRAERRHKKFLPVRIDSGYRPPYNRVETSTKYQVRGIPTLLLFKGGEVAAMKVGAVPKSDLAGWVKTNIA